MSTKDKQCVYCQRIVAKDKAIKKYTAYFCRLKCLMEYEKLLEKANEKKFDNCC